MTPLANPVIHIFRLVNHCYALFLIFHKNPPVIDLPSPPTTSDNDRAILPPDDFTEDEGSGVDDSDDEKNLSNKSAKIEKVNDIPNTKYTHPDWDPTKCSPIYFGRSRMTGTEEAAQQKNELNLLRLREQRALHNAKVSCPLIIVLAF